MININSGINNLARRFIPLEKKHNGLHHRSCWGVATTFAMAY